MAQPINNAQDVFVCIPQVLVKTTIDYFII